MMTTQTLMKSVVASATQTGLQRKGMLGYAPYALIAFSPWPLLASATPLCGTAPSRCY
jgi:hypothetical protein